MACHFCLRHSTCLYYLSLSFIALLVDTNIYRSLRELDCLENRFSSFLNFGEVPCASVLGDWRDFCLFGERKGIGREEKRKQPKAKNG